MGTSMPVMVVMVAMSMLVPTIVAALFGLIQTEALETIALPAAVVISPPPPLLASSFFPPQPPQLLFPFLIRSLPLLFHLSHLGRAALHHRQGIIGLDPCCIAILSAGVRPAKGVRSLVLLCLAAIWILSRTSSGRCRCVPRSGCGSLIPSCIGEAHPILILELALFTRLFGFHFWILALVRNSRAGLAKEVDVSRRIGQGGIAALVRHDRARDRRTLIVASRPRSTGRHFPGDAHLKVGIVLAMALAPLALPSMAARRISIPAPVPVPVSLVRAGLPVLTLWRCQRQRLLSSQDGEAPRGVFLLLALLISQLAVPGGGLVAPHPRDVVAVIDIPRLFPE